MEHIAKLNLNNTHFTVFCSLKLEINSYCCFQVADHNIGDYGEGMLTVLGTAYKRIQNMEERCSMDMDFKMFLFSLSLLFYFYFYFTFIKPLTKSPQKVVYSTAESGIFSNTFMRKEKDTLQMTRVLYNEL